MSRMADLAALLTSRGVTDPILDTEVIDMPDRIVVLTMTGGAGTENERVFDRLAVQVRVRGNQGMPAESAADAESLAGQVDAALMGTVCPILLSGRAVVDINYLGGPPAFLTRDPANRAIYACGYLLKWERDPAAR